MFCLKQIRPRGLVVNNDVTMKLSLPFKITMNINNPGRTFKGNISNTLLKPLSRGYTVVIILRIRKTLLSVESP